MGQIVQVNVSPIKVLNQVSMLRKFLLVTAFDSVGVPPMIWPPLVATFIVDVLMSYWYTAVSHDAVLAVIGEKQAELATGAGSGCRLLNRSRVALRGSLEASLPWGCVCVWC